MSGGKDDVDEKIERILTELATNTQVSKDILIQTTKTNGRVTELERKSAAHDTIHALEAERKLNSDWWKDKLGGAVIVLIVGAMGFGLSLVLQKTKVIDVSTVSDEQYDAITNSLSE